MLQLDFLRNNRDLAIKRLAIKNFDASTLIDEVIDLDQSRKNAQKELDEIRTISNRLAKEIGILYKTGQRDKAEELKLETAQLKQQSKELEQWLKPSVN